MIRLFGHLFHSCGTILLIGIMITFGLNTTAVSAGTAPEHQTQNLSRASSPPVSTSEDPRLTGVSDNPTGVHDDSGPSRTAIVIFFVAAILIGAALHGVLVKRHNKSLTELRNMLRESEDRYRHLFQNSPFAVAVFRPCSNGNDFIIEDINAAAEKIDVLRRDAVIGRSIKDVFPAAEDSGFLDILRGVVGTGKHRQSGTWYYEDDRIAGWRDGAVHAMPSGYVIALYRDATQEKTRDHRLSLSEETIRAILNVPTDISMVLSTEGKIIDVNETAVHRLGTLREQLIGRDLWSLFPPEVAERRKAYIDIVHMTREAVRFEDERDGRWNDTVISPVFDNDGTVTRTIVIARDITERKMMEERIQHLNDVLRAIRNVNQLITVEKDRDLLITRICDTLIETRGYHNAWIVLLDEKNAFHTAVESGVGEAFQHLTENMTQGRFSRCQQDALATDTIIITKDPERECPGCPLSRVYGDRSGLTTALRHGERVFGLMSVSVPGRVVTDYEEHRLFQEVADDIAYALHTLDMELLRRCMEAELRASEERFSKAFRSNPAPTMISTIEEGRFIDVNDACLDMLAYERTDMVGKTAIELSVWANVHDRERLIARLKEDGALHNVWITIMMSGKRPKPVLWSAELIQLEGKEVMLSQFFDPASNAYRTGAFSRSDI